MLPPASSNYPSTSHLVSYAESSLMKVLMWVRLAVTVRILSIPLKTDSQFRDKILIHQIKNLLNSTNISPIKQTHQALEVKNVRKWDTRRKLVSMRSSNHVPTSKLSFAKTVTVNSSAAFFNLWMSIIWRIQICSWRNKHHQVNVTIISRKSFLMTLRKNQDKWQVLHLTVWLQSSVPSLGSWKTMKLSLIKLRSKLVAAKQKPITKDATQT